MISIATTLSFTIGTVVDSLIVLDEVPVSKTTGDGVAAIFEEGAAAVFEDGIAPPAPDIKYVPGPIIDLGTGTTTYAGTDIAKSEGKGPDA